MVTFAMPLLLTILFFHYCYHIMYCSMCPFSCFLFSLHFQYPESFDGFSSPKRRCSFSIKKKQRTSVDHRGGTCRLATTFLLMSCERQVLVVTLFFIFCLFLSFTSAFDASTLGFGVLLAIACSVPAVALLPFLSTFLDKISLEKFLLIFFSSLFFHSWSLFHYSSSQYPSSQLLNLFSCRHPDLRHT